MGDRRTRNSNRWATYTSFFPIWGKHAASAIRQNALAKNQQEAADKLNPIDPTYQVSPYAQEQLNNARNAMNARMPGAAQLENNVFRNQANTMMSLSRAATPQQQIAAAGALQGGTDNALSNLAMQESQYRNAMMGNLNSALQIMTDENDKVYGDQLRKFNRDFDLKQGLLNSAERNRAGVSESIGNGVGAIANTVLQFAGLGNQAVPNNAANQNIPNTQGVNGLTDSQRLQGGYAQQYGFNPGASNWFMPTRRP